MATSPNVYNGFWTNYTNGTIRGATLTLSSQGGAFLVAFLALYVRIAGGHFWKIICRGFFHFNARKASKPQDGLHHQHQAILRNNSSATHAFLLFLRTGWAWRRRAPRSFRRSTALVMAAVANIAAFAVAAIFSSSATSTGSEVLLRSSLCGMLDWPDATESTSLAGSIIIAQGHGDLVESAGYVSTCTNSTSQNARCEPYGRQQVNGSLSTNSSLCPFSSEMCTSATATLDSGFMNSHLDFGINSPPEDRITYRRILQCSVLTTEEFRSNWTDDATAGLEYPLNASSGAEEVMQYFYGPNIYYESTQEGWKSNATFIHSNLSSGPMYGLSYRDLFGLDAESAVLNYTSSSSFIPIPQLRRNDADVYLIFLANNVLFTSPVNDPWFTASFPRTSSTGVIYYTASSSSPVSVLGCTQQAQFCNPSKSACSPLTGFLMDFDVGTLNLTSKQRTVFERLNTTISYGSGIAAVTTILGPPSMLATLFDVNGYSLPYPDDQWVQELSNWFQIILTNMQLQVSRFVGGPSNPTSQKYITSPTKEDRWMCDAQMVQRQNSASFSVLGIGLLLGLGGLIIGISIILELTADILQDQQEDSRRLGSLEWSLSGTLQLQRMAFEGRGHNDWDKISSTSLVPVTKGSERFGLLSATLDESERMRIRKNSTWWSLSPTQSFKRFGSKFSRVTSRTPTEDRNASERSMPRAQTPGSTINVSIPDSTIPLHELSRQESLRSLLRPSLTNGTDENTDLHPECQPYRAS